MSSLIANLCTDTHRNEHSAGIPAVCAIGVANGASRDAKLSLGTVFFLHCGEAARVFPTGKPIHRVLHQLGAGM